MVHGQRDIKIYLGSYPDQTDCIFLVTKPLCLCVNVYCTTATEWQHNCS